MVWGTDIQLKKSYVYTANKKKHVCASQLETCWGVTFLSLETLSQKHQKHLARRCFHMNLWMFNLTFKCIIKIHKAKNHMLILFIVMLWVKQIVASFASSAINYITKKLYLHKLFYSTHIYITEPVQPRSNNITHWWVVAIYKICLHFFSSSS